MFIEHLGPLVYRSLWSEMLDDRKFYFPITPAAPRLETSNPEAGGGCSFENGFRLARRKL